MLDRDLVAENSFAKITIDRQLNPDWTVFIARPTVQRVLDTVANSQWRVLISLRRFGGLQIGEALWLRRHDIDWDARRMQVRSSKTEHREGGRARAVPVFPELYPLLMEAFEASNDDSRILSDLRVNLNSGTHLGGIVDCAGTTRCPRMLHKLRASRQNELMTGVPDHHGVRLGRL